MSRRTALLVAVLVVFASLPVLTAAGNGGDARSEHQRIVDFWTWERVSQARPRDFVRNPGGDFSPAARPGGGGGGSTVITGASWTKGGLIAETEGKVLFAMGGSYYVCSATAVTESASGRSIVVTAGHCVYDETGGAFATNWMFIPNYDAAPAPLDRDGTFCASTKYGCWTASALVVNDGYASAGGFNDTAVLYDWGFAVLGTGGKSGQLLENVVGTQNIAFTSIAFGTTAFAFGYPAEGKYKGNDLIYCSGPVDGDPYNDNLTYRMNGCKLNGGSSGGGWLYPFSTSTGAGTVRSVNSYGYSGVQAMHGPFFNSATQATYNAAVSVTSNTIVP